MVGIDFGGLIIEGLLLNAILAAGILCAIIAVAMFAKKRKWGFRIALVLAVLFAGSLAGYSIWNRPPTPKPYDISLVIADDWVYSKTLPGEETSEIRNGSLNHRVWGMINVDITLPDGKTIRGTSKQINIYTNYSRITTIILSYRPSETISAVEYWQQGGTIYDASNKNSSLIDRGTYSVEIRETDDGEINLLIKNPPSDRIGIYKKLRRYAK